MKHFIVPSMSPQQARVTISLSLLGIVIAGSFGIVHDQITYTIGPSYYQKFKFVNQFEPFDFGWHPRLFAATVGFLATWWIGLIFGWVIGRMVSSIESLQSPILFGVKIIGGLLFFIICGCILGFAWASFSETPDNLAVYQEALPSLEDAELSSFRTVGCIHNGGYLGGVLGGIVCIVYLNLKKKRWRKTLNTSTN